MNSDFALFHEAKERAKAGLLTILRQRLEDPAFDIVTFADLLAQDVGGEDGGNPLHTCFDAKVVSLASVFLRAVELVNESLAIAEEPGTTNEASDPPPDEDVPHILIEDGSPADELVFGEEQEKTGD